MLSYARTEASLAVAMCVQHLRPPRLRPTPHGFVAVVAGALPFYIKDAANEVVGIEDAANALLLAADRVATASAISSPSAC